ncbi:MAG: ATP-dependent RecD-like DNA helicase [Clostridia bacterium]|nr:ATP-dependent RecD-like DNA helicase [Clostridia bacterium]
METEIIKGTVNSVIYVNELNRHTILKLLTDGGEITVAGTFADVNPGEILTLTGSFVVHSKYGRQFNSVSYEKELPERADVIMKYLSSGAIKGIGPVTAKAIVDKFGNDSLNVIENHPDKLAKVRGITYAKAEQFAAALARENSARTTIISLIDLGIEANHAIKIFDAYGEAAVDTVERNPYAIYEAVRGFDFPACDALAARLGFDGEFPRRIEAGLRYMLRYNLQNGHTYLPRKQLTELTATMLTVTPSVVDEALINSVDKAYLTAFGDAGAEKIFLPEYFTAENNCAERLYALNSYKTRALRYKDLLPKIEKENSIKYSEKQTEAIIAAAENGIFVLTGGPGTGKTTTLRGIISLFERNGMKILLAAPTGRAAMRMTALTGKEAKTIHRLLEVVPNDDDDIPVFTRDESNPLECDAVIIDELSMVDVIVFDALLRAIKPGCRLVLVGDYNQLPSVGAGNILEDIIKSEIIHCVDLDVIFRQSEDSLIVTNAHSIVNGEMPVLNDTKRDFFFLRGNDAASIADIVVDLCVNRLPKAYGADPFRDIQIISPTRIGESGTAALNARLQAVLNPASPRKGERAYGNTVFRVGDKVMQTKNNYDIIYKTANGCVGAGIYNGDIGMITSIGKEPFITIDFDGRQAQYAFEWLGQLEHAYAITAHKSQGSEYSYVIFPTAAPKKLQYRNLFYTAVTRAKDMCIVVGSREDVEYMTKNNKERRRYTALAQFLRLEAL